nr:MAG TPA: protein of unknown function (DUF4972) [Caudoviricetes sp.]
MKTNLIFKVCSLFLSLFAIITLASCNNDDQERQMTEEHTTVDELMNDAETVSSIQTRSGGTYSIKKLTVNAKMYRANQSQTIDCAALRATPFQNDDWGNALYFWDSPYKNYLDSDHPYFIEVTMRKTLNVIYTDEPGFMDGSYNMTEVIASVEKLIGAKKPAGTPFLQWLGQNKYGFYYLENPDREQAIIVPHLILDDDLFNQKVTDQYKK